MNRSGSLRMSVIIPVLNDADGLRRCLQSFVRNGVPSPDTEVIVVDNGSTDGTLEVARECGAASLLLPHLRVGELRDKGAEAARGRILAFVDADHEIVGGWVEAACSLLAEAGVGAAGAAYLSPSSGTWVQRMYGRLRGRPSGRRDIEWLASGNLAVRRDVFLEAGGFDTSLEACEDVDLCQRLRAAGWRVVSDERLGSVHHGDPARVGSLFRSELWRGRDNITVSLRHLTLRGLPSALIPAFDLACLVAIFAALVIATAGAARAAHALSLALSASAGIGIFALIRAARMMGSPGPSGPVEWSRALLVAATYDLARALALVYRQPHRRAR